MLAAHFSARSQDLEGCGIDDGGQRENNGHGNSTIYGTIGNTGDKRSPQIAQDTQSSGWLDYFMGFRVLFPYIWFSIPSYLVNFVTD